ncbi:MAG: 3-methyl-2-oxobutanoate hydroxymethyltransferase [Firmicutes bacterium]|nr:3-methyl-2-oxobutanoate hydroxymethyltransferase [Bacillota bacterium]MBR0373632.1 3-methyl-2-oxobutanoate hydroxymethyltransferase [Mogibacterium sp.]
MGTKKKFSALDFKRCKDEGRKFNMVVAYDYTMASIIDESDIESILVGDSCGMLCQGLKGTTAVTMDQMIYHTKCVVAGAPNTFVVGDMPFGSYQESCEQAIHNATRLMKEGGCDAVKLEGGIEIIDKIKAITQIGIPVMGHIGLLPQTAAMTTGGFKVQGKDYATARKIIDDAKALEEAGVFMIGLECVPAQLTKVMAKEISTPINGIGAGVYDDGPGIVTYDMLGLTKGRVSKFTRKYLNMREEVLNALNQFHADCCDRTYPSEDESYNMIVEGLE